MMKSILVHLRYDKGKPQHRKIDIWTKIIVSKWDENCVFLNISKRVQKCYPDKKYRSSRVFQVFYILINFSDSWKSCETYVPRSCSLKNLWTSPCFIVNKCQHVRGVGQDLVQREEVEPEPCTEWVAQRSSCTENPSASVQKQNDKQTRLKTVLPPLRRWKVIKPKRIFKIRHTHHFLLSVFI